MVDNPASPARARASGYDGGVDGTFAGRSWGFGQGDRRLDVVDVVDDLT
jgi:hypothetical protein